MGDLNIPYLFMGLILIGVWIIYRIINLKNEKSSIHRRIIINIFFTYFLAVIYFTFFKDGRLEISITNFGNKYVNIIPLRETIKMFIDDHMGIKNALYNVVGNILLFVPLGFFIPMLFKKLNNAKKILLYGFIASVTIEFIQYFTPMNMSDVDDVIFNTMGALLGLACYRAFYKISKCIKRDKLIDSIQDKEKNDLIKIVVKPLGAMLVCCLIFTFSMIYTNTYSSKLSDKELAVKAFARYDSGKVVSYKKYDKYVFFIKDNGDYINLCNVEKVLNSRYTEDFSIQLNLSNKKFGYGVDFVGDHNKNLLTPMVFGKNKNSDSVSITLYGKEYKERLKPNEYFIVVYPHYVKLKNNADVYNIYKNQESKDLQIKFYDKDGITSNDMELCR